MAADPSAKPQNPLEQTARSGLSLGLLVWGFMTAAVAATLYARQALWLPPLAAQEGAAIDRLIEITLWVTGAAFLLVHALLGYFLIRYRTRGQPKAYYFPHSTPLEVTYTAVPAVVMVALSVAGMVLWTRIHAPPPPNSFLIEIRGQQFSWSARYPGPDGRLGRVDNRIPQPFNVDPKDPAGRDDVVSSEIYLVVNRPAHILLRTSDIQHSFWVPAFRLKKDLLPGSTTELWLTPTRTGTFDIVCAELCGVGHYTMRGELRVVTQGEFDRWLEQQRKR